MPSTGGSASSCGVALVRAQATKKVANCSRVASTPGHAIGRIAPARTTALWNCTAPEM